jgi:hypothetical protein
MASRYAEKMLVAESVAVNQINRIISAAVRQIAHSCGPAVENIQQALRES